MVRYFRDAGIKLGDQPLTYTEIKNWSEMTCTPVNQWISSTLRGMSVQYINGYIAGTNGEQSPLYDSVLTKAEKAEILSNKIRAAFGISKK